MLFSTDTMTHTTAQSFTFNNQEPHSRIEPWLLFAPLAFGDQCTFFPNWSTITYILLKYHVLGLLFRHNVTHHGPELPLQQPRARQQDGHWTAPYYDCGGGDIWMVTYSAPIFGWDDTNNVPIFRYMLSDSVKYKLHVLFHYLNSGSLYSWFSGY